jgi:exopolysaccharide biosynthesis protein
MVELGAKEAINLDGGGSSQLWYAGSYLHYSSRPVAQGMIVFSEFITQLGDVPIDNP